MELEIDTADKSDDAVVDFESSTEKKLEDMIAVHEKIFGDAADNIKKLRSSTKDDDKKRRTNQVQILFNS